jgi:hypothetical protein
MRVYSLQITGAKREDRKAARLHFQQGHGIEVPRGAEFCCARTMRAASSARGREEG